MPETMEHVVRSRRDGRTTTTGEWVVACDSYGKVRHSKKACVYTTVKDDTGAESLTTVAGRIENWADAKLIAKSPDMHRVLSAVLHQLKHGEASDFIDTGTEHEFRGSQRDLKWCRQQIDAVLKSLD